MRKLARAQARKRLREPAIEFSVSTARGAPASHARESAVRLAARFVVPVIPPALIARKLERPARSDGVRVRRDGPGGVR